MYTREFVLLQDPIVSPRPWLSHFAGYPHTLPFHCELHELPGLHQSNHPYEASELRVRKTVQVIANCVVHVLPYPTSSTRIGVVFPLRRGRIYVTRRE